MPNRPEKLTSLQALRLYAFLGIFLLHSQSIQTGAWGVSIFIVLSGFLMVYNYMDKDISAAPLSCVKFSFKRINKLYPLHILTFFLYALIVFYVLKGDYSRYNVGKVAIGALANIALVQSYVPDPDIYFSFNAVAWYLSMCTLLYFAFPFILKKIQTYTSRKNALKAIAATVAAEIAAAGIGYLLEHLGGLNIGETGRINIAKWVSYIFPLFRLGEFIIGCNLGYIFLHRKDKNTRPDVKHSIYEILSLGVCVAIIYIYTAQKGILGSEWFRYSVIYIPSSILLVYLFAERRGVISRLSDNKVFVYLGDLSAYMFFIHQIVIMFMQHIVCPRIYIIGYKKRFVIVCFLLSVLLSWLWKLLTDLFRKIAKRNAKAEV